MNFDKIAKAYDSYSFPINQLFVDFIIHEFDIKKSTSILDLGCGAGNLTFPLRCVSDNVSGLDLSNELLSIAVAKDRKNTVSWICNDVSKFNFPNNTYNLIISLESFHLFPHQTKILTSIVKSLINKGIFAIVYCIYFWEDMLREIITRCFFKYNIKWNIWNYQSCNNINSINIQNVDYFFTEKAIKLNEQYSIDSIVNYLLSISKSAKLNINTKFLLKEELTRQFTAFFGRDLIKGATNYYVKFMQKD